ncbi:MAG: pilus assembly protein TadG-related protein [Clostridia bacterium]
MKPVSKALSDEKGSVIVFVALATTVLLGFAATVVDAGILYFNRVALSNAADAAALAGVQELPDSQELARVQAIAFAVKNGVRGVQVSAAPAGAAVASDVPSVDAAQAAPVARAAQFVAGALGWAAENVMSLAFGSMAEAASAVQPEPVPGHDVLTVTFPDSRSIQVTISRAVPLGFARIFGFATSKVSASATARVGAARAVTGAVPFSVVKQNFVYGERYILKHGPHAPGEEPGYGEHHGNFGGLALGGRGGSNYREKIQHGYEGWLEVGQWIETEPGNMSGPTVQGVEYRLAQCHHDPPCTFDKFVKGCPRMVIVPVIDSLEGVHGRDKVLLVGFAAFFLEGVDGRGSDCNVWGRFIRWATDGELGDTQDYGLVAYELVQ